MATINPATQLCRLIGNLNLHPAATMRFVNMRLNSKAYRCCNGESIVVSVAWRRADSRHAVRACRKLIAGDYSPHQANVRLRHLPDWPSRTSGARLVQTIHPYPGGDIEIGEKSEDALVREIQEEFGLYANIEWHLGAIECQWPEESTDNHEINLLFEVNIPEVDVRTSQESLEPHIEFVLLDIYSLTSLNIAAKKLYAKHGFKEVGERDDGDVIAERAV